MNRVRYVGFDVHQASTSVAVHNAQGKCLVESILETSSEVIGSFLSGLGGTLHVTFEEGIHAAWLYDLIKPLVADVVVCNPRANKLLTSGIKGNLIDHKLLVG